MVECLVENGQKRYILWLVLVWSGVYGGIGYTYSSLYIVVEMWRLQFSSKNKAAPEGLLDKLMILGGWMRGRSA